MKETSELEFFEMFHRMRRGNVARVVIRYGKYLYARVEKLALENGFAEYKPHYLGILGNIGPNGTTSSELARCIWVSKQAASKMLKEVEALGYISYHPHEHDGRANIIRLTPKGLDLLAFSLKVGDLMKAEMVDVVGEEKIDQLIDIMNLLLDDATEKMNLENKEH